MRDGRPTRVLIASHSHPAITRGGAEIAAFQLFRAFSDLPAWEAWFLGCQNNRSGERLGAAVTQPFSTAEFVYSTGNFEWFKFANRDPNFPKAFRVLLEKLQPDIVHFHHFINFGVEVFYHVRKVLPDAKIVLTVHEYLSICHHYGQMVTKGHENLCYEAISHGAAGAFLISVRQIFFCGSNILGVFLIWLITLFRLATF